MNKRTITLAAVLATAFAFSGPARAAKFANQFTEFELPPQWGCNLEGAEWICQNANDAKKRDAIIVLAAKLKGDQDSLDQYLAYLKAPKTYTSIQGKPVKSEPKYTKSVSLNGQPWVDSLHLESEIPGYFTRYLATIKQDIGVLVTYSINKAKYQQYLQDFDNMVKTLKVFRKQGAGINAGPAQGNIFQQTQIPQNMSESTVFPGGVNPAGGSDAVTKKKEDNSLLIILLVAGAGIGFIIWRKRKSG
ncbi:MAG: hypothetical protein A2583_10440 [Bdellovibrionales bacterium RIFOXYD1_FULL_53_11]|nr:MAG: hypothetical protein A2583_10440 [Bdellovibrionales bacterium RIFOXYD1_FULL_53_11]